MVAVPQGERGRGEARHRIVKAAPLVVDQVADLYDRELAEYLLNKGLSFRSMHSHGRALNALLPHAVEDVEAYDVREGELISERRQRLELRRRPLPRRASCSRRSRSAAGSRTGDVRVVTLESEPMPARRPRQAALRDLRRRRGPARGGFVAVADMVSRQPWLDESFDFPVEVDGGQSEAARRRHAGMTAGA